MSLCIDSGKTDTSSEILVVSVSIENLCQCYYFVSYRQFHFVTLYQRAVYSILIYFVFFQYSEMAVYVSGGHDNASSFLWLEFWHFTDTICKVSHLREYTSRLCFLISLYHQFDFSATSTFFQRSKRSHQGLIMCHWSLTISRLFIPFRNSLSCIYLRMTQP